MVTQNWLWPLHCSTISDTLLLNIQTFDTTPPEFITCEIYHICYQLFTVILCPSLQVQHSQFLYSAIVAFLWKFALYKLESRKQRQIRKKRLFAPLDLYLHTCRWNPAITNMRLRNFTLHKQRSPIDQSLSRAYSYCTSLTPILGGISNRRISPKNQVTTEMTLSY